MNLVNDNGCFWKQGIHTQGARNVASEFDICIWLVATDVLERYCNGEQIGLVAEAIGDPSHTPIYLRNIENVHFQYIDVHGFVQDHVMKDLQREMSLVDSKLVQIDQGDDATVDLTSPTGSPDKQRPRRR